MVDRERDAAAKSDQGLEVIMERFEAAELKLDMALESLGVKEPLKQFPDDMTFTNEPKVPLDEAIEKIQAGDPSTLLVGTRRYPYWGIDHTAHLYRAMETMNGSSHKCISSTIALVIPVLYDALYDALYIWYEQIYIFTAWLQALIQRELGSRGISSDIGNFPTVLP